jgi:hypothetical protein
MRDLKSITAIFTKGGLFLFLGLTASVLLWAELRTLKAAVLLAVAVWGFCRAYYFAFYVVQHYVDPGYRFSGLLAFARYLFKRKTTPRG